MIFFNLMKKYKNNMDIRDLEFEERKKSKVEQGIKLAEEKQAELNAAASSLTIEDAPAGESGNEASGSGGDGASGSGGDGASGSGSGSGSGSSGDA